jgi:hypothetical protein
VDDTITAHKCYRIQKQPWRQLLSLPIPSQVTHPMCTGSDLIARVARTRLTYAENLVSWDLLGAYEDGCARAVPACGVRKCGVGARRESGQRHGCVEAVPGAAGGWRTLVGSPLHQRGHVRTVCGRAHGGLGDAVSSHSTVSGIRRRLDWCGVWWLFQGCCAGRRRRYGTAAAWRAGTRLSRKVPNNAYSQGSQELSASAGAY